MEIKKIMELAIYAGEILLSSGAEIYRVEETVERICSNYNVNIECFALPNGLFLSSHGEGNKTEPISLMKRIKKRSLDLQRIEQINSFSREIEKKSIDIDEAFKYLERIDNGPYFKFRTRLFGAGIAALSYAMLVNGSILDGIISFLIAIIIYSVQMLISKAGFFQFFEYFLSGLIAGIISITIKYFIPEINLDKVIAGAIIILVPGVAITSGIKDALYGDLMSSVARISEALLIVTAVGAGVGIMLSLGMGWM